MPDLDEANTFLNKSFLKFTIEIAEQKTIAIVGANITKRYNRLITSVNLVLRLSLLCLPWSLEERTLFAAGHVTTQNLGGKKICWAGGVAECFDCCCGKLCGFQNLEQSLKTTHSHITHGLMCNFAIEECYIFSAVSKI